LGKCRTKLRSACSRPASSGRLALKAIVDPNKKIVSRLNLTLIFCSNKQVDPLLLVCILNIDVGINFLVNDMAGRQAKILSGEQIEILLAYAAATRHPSRNRVIVLLSVKAGLRASEIASVTWDMVVDPTGAVGSMLELQDHAAKNKSGRTIPLHPDLRAALIAWRDRTGAVVGPIIASKRGTRMT
jgi:integrase